MLCTFVSCYLHGQQMETERHLYTQYYGIMNDFSIVMIN